MNQIISFLNENAKKAFIDIIGHMLEEGNFKQDPKGRIRPHGVIFRAFRQLKQRSEWHRIKGSHWKDVEPIVLKWFLSELKRRGMTAVEQDSFFSAPEETLERKKSIPIKKIRSIRRIRRGAYGAELRHKRTLGNGY